MCHEDKPEEAFAFQSLATGERQAQCRACHAVYRRAHYLRTKPAYIENERLRLRGHRERNRALIIEYLLAHPCVDCGETDPIVLDFDHRDPSTKRLAVGRLANKKRWPQVRAEIEKCDVRCASCHRRRTARQFAWRRASPSALHAEPGAQTAPVGASTPLLASETAELRACSTCGELRPLSEFALKSARTGRRSTKCRSCQRAYSRAHYRKERSRYLDKAKQRNRASRDRFALLILDYLRSHPCVDCGETDPTVLEFDHRDPSAKSSTVNALGRAQDWTALETEIAKCDVRCANCHRRRTARQFSWISRVSEDGAAA